MPSKPAHSRCRAWRLTAASLTFLTTVSLFTTCIPTEPASPVTIAFRLTPDTVLLAVGEQRQPGFEVTADGTPLPEPRLSIKSGDEATVSVGAENRLTAMRRGRTSIAVELVSGALGAVDADSSFPVRVIVGGLALAYSSHTLTSLGETLSCRPGFRDAGGGAITSDSTSLTGAVTFALTSAGNAVELASPQGLIRALANGVDTVRATLDTASVELEVVVQQRAASVAVSEQSFTFRSLQEPHQFDAEAFDALGNAVPNPDIVWSSTDESIVTVAGGGSTVTATSAGNGTAGLVASTEGVADTVLVTVQQVARRTRPVSGDGQTGTVGQPLGAAFVVQITDSVGNDVAVADVGVTFQVTSGGGNLSGAGSMEVMTDAQGRASATLTLGTAAGANEVTAAVADPWGSPTMLGATGTPAAAVSMAAASGDLQEAGAGATLPDPFAVLVQDAFGNGVPGYDVTFSVTGGGGDISGQPSKVAPTNASGYATSYLTLGPGIGDLNTVEASAPGLTGSPLTFSATALVPVATVDVTPASDSIDVGSSTQLLATTLDANGDTLTGRPVAWSTSASQVATVDGGLVQGVAAGDATITTRSENASGSAEIAVLGGVQSITLTPDPAEMYAEDTLRLTAAMVDDVGHPLTRPTVEWSSTDESLATVDASGLVSGLWPGVDTIVAAAEGKADSVVLTILEVPVASVAVLPQQLKLYALNETSPLTAEARNSVGRLINTASFSWASRDLSVAMVDQDGVVTAQNTGDTYVVATSGGQSDSAHVSVLVPTQLSCSDAGVTHDADITVSERWGLGVHYVSPSIVVDGADVVLTVDPGALVCLGGGDGITFQNGARLDARGQPDALIVWTTDPGNTWRSLTFTGSPSDTSHLTNALIEHTHDGSGAVVALDRHAVALDSVVVRNTRWQGVSLGAPGSRVSRSVITNTGLDGASPAVWMSDSTMLEETAVQNSAGTGVQVSSVDVRLRNIRIESAGDVGLDAYSASLAEAVGVRVVGSGSYPLRGDIRVFSLIVSTQEAQDSLLGNARDSVVITASETLRDATVTARAGLPWRLEGNVNIGSGAVFVAEPGAAVVATQDWQMVGVGNGGRLDVRGSATDTVVFTAVTEAGQWQGLEIMGAAPDTSYVSYALVEYAANQNGGWQNAAIVSGGGNPVVIEHTRVRQSPESAIWLDEPGSRIAHVVVDTTNTGSPSRSAVRIRESMRVENLVIRGSGGQGLQMTDGSPILGMSGLRVVDAAAHPVVTSAENLVVWDPSAADYDSLVGNGRDTVVVTGGTVTNDTVTAPGSYPWYVTGTISLDGGLLRAEPGASLAFEAGGSAVFTYNGGRVEALGTASDSVRFTVADLNQGNWSGIRLEGSPTDTSRFDYALIEHANSCQWDGNYNCAALQVPDDHPVVVQHSRVRQSTSAIWLDAHGSMLRDVVVDSVTSGNTAVWLGDSTAFDGFTVRGAQGWGVQIGGPLVTAAGLRVVGGGDRPLITPIENVGLLIQTAADYDSLRGNLRDTLHVTGGTLRQDTIPVLADFPWYVDGTVYFDTLSLLDIEPGAHLAFDGNGAFVFDNTGRLRARGTETDPIVFTGAWNSTWPGLQFQSAEGDPFTPPPRDTSYLTNVRISRMHGIANGAGVVSEQLHALVIDSAVIRQSNSGALNLGGYGSRISRSVIDTSYSGGWTASLGDSTTLEETVIRPSANGGWGLQVNGASDQSGITVRDFRILGAGSGGLDAGWSDAWIENGRIQGSGGVGLQAYGQLRQAWNIRVTGSVSYGARLSIHNLGLLTVTAGDQDSLLGNGRDTLVITGGTLRNDTVTVRADVPWRLESYAQVDAGGLLLVEPGARVSATYDGALHFTNGGHLDARGTAADTILFTVATTGSSWRGFQFENTADTSYLEYVRIQRARSIWDDSNQWAIQAYNNHPVVIRNTLIRQSFYGAVGLFSPGSEIHQSRVDTTGSANPPAAVALGDSTTFEATTVRRSLSRGVDASGQGMRILGGLIANSAGDGLIARGTVQEGAVPRVVGSGGYPLRAELNPLAALLPTAGAYDSLLGNARDTVIVDGSQLSDGTVVAAATLPWRVDGNLEVRSGALLRAEPGARVAVQNGVQLQFYDGGRVDARGTVTDTVVFTRFDPNGSWHGLDFWGTPADSSYLVNARVEYAEHWDVSWNNAAVAARDQHALIIDGTIIRQSPQSAVYFSAPGSRISRSRIDTTNTTDSWREAVWLEGSAILEDVVIRGSGGQGLEMTSGTNTRVSGLTVVGAAYFPVATNVQNLGIWGPTAADYANLTGNGRDSLIVTGGTLTNDTITASASLPWLVSGGVAVESGALMVAEPGAGIAVTQDNTLYFQGGGRLDARGTAADSVVFAARDPNSAWGGLWFDGLPPDTSYLVNARVEHGRVHWAGENASIVSVNRHPVIIDSALIRQSPSRGVWLQAPGSRISRSRIDTTGWGEGIRLSDSTAIVDVAVTGAGDVGVWMDNSIPLLEVRGLSVTGSASYPVVTSMENLALWQPTSAGYDSLLGNARDTLLIQSWGIASSGDLLVAEAVPWRITNNVFVEGSAVLRAEPGATIAYSSGAKLHAQNGGRLDLHGSDTEPVLMTVTDPGDLWDGIWLGGTPSDTSRLVNVRLEHVRQWGNWPDPAVYAQNPHAVVIDSSTIRQSASAVYLGAPGSRFANSVVDTTFTDYPAVKMDGGTEVQSITVRRSAGSGFEFTAGTLAAIDDLQVVQTLGYPVNLTPANLAVWSPTATDDDLLAGNPNDSVTVQDGTASGATMVLGSAVVWRQDGGLTVEGGGVLQLEPGARWVATQDGSHLTFQNGGRLEAQGTVTDSILFTSTAPNGFSGINFYGTPGGTGSYLDYARVEYGQSGDGGRNTAAIVAADQHPVDIDHSLIRRSAQSGVWLEAPGSRLRNSVIDTTLTGDPNMEAVRAHGSTTVENVLIRGSQGQGLQMTDGDLTAVSGLEIVDAAQFPVLTTAKNVGIWNPSDAAYDSLLGNAQDTLIVTGGDLSADTITATDAYPWRITGNLTLGTGGLLRAESGAYVAMGAGIGIQANNGGNVPGRVDLRGSATAPVVFTGRGGSGWNGFWLDGTPGDTSYFVNVRIEHAGQDWTDPAAIFATGSHAAVIDSTHIFEPRGRGVWLGAAGSRIARSTITNAGWEWGGYEGARLGVATTFADNTVTGSSGHGVYITASDVTVSGSEITGSGNDGVLVESGSNIFVNYCNLYGNASNGLTNWTGSSVDAKNNWWGDAAGPTGPNGDGVSGPNAISPWALVPFTITSPAPAPPLAAITVTPAPTGEIR